MDGHKLLTIGILFCVFGLIFGLAIYSRLKNLPVHRAMREVSELIYETCKTYLFTQGKFLLFLWVFIAVVIVLYFGVLSPVPDKPVGITLPIILLFSLLGMAGSYGVAWFGIRVNTFANSRTAFAGLRGKPYPIYQIPLQAGMSIGMMLISVELLMMLFILLFVPGDYAGPCFIGFAIGESLGAAALRIAGGIFTKIADIGSDLMKIVFKIKEDDARNPGVIADCTGDNAGDSVGPSADGFETYGVTGVALITFILLGVKDPVVQVQLLVWIFVMRIAMLVASAAAYFINAAYAKARFGNADKMNFEQYVGFCLFAWLVLLEIHFVGVSESSLGIGRVDEISRRAGDQHGDAHSANPHQRYRTCTTGSFTPSRINVMSATPVTPYVSKPSAVGPTESPALSPVQSAITPGLRASSSLILKTIFIRSEPMSAILVKMPPRCAEPRRPAIRR